MATGTVKYSALMTPHQEVYNGRSAKTWNVTQTGAFPKSKYAIKSAVIKYDIRNVYASNRHMKVYRRDGSNDIELGDVPTGSGGKHSENLSTSISYEGIKTIKLDGVERWACQLRGGSYVEIIVTWEETAPVVVTPPAPHVPLVVTGTESQSSIRNHAQQAIVSVSIEGVDISEAVNQYLLSLSYTDNEEDEADDLQIKLQDKDGDWLQRWLNDILQSAAAAGRSKTTKTDTYTISDKRASIRNQISRDTRSYDCMIGQIYLALLGYFKGTINGKSGADTVAAVKAFQKAQKITSDGIIGRVTWPKLTNAVNGRTCTKYICYFKNNANIQVYAKNSTSSKKLFVMKKGTECIITDKVASGWYAVTFGDKSGFCKGSNVTADRAVAATVDVKTETKGLSIVAGITLQEPSGRTRKMNCGSFELDSLKASGPPSTITIKGTSLPYGNGVRTEERDKAWEGYTVSKIGREIAQRAGLGFLYDAPTDPAYSRIEQAKQTDIAFLQEICHKNGLSLKAHSQKLIIFDQARYEALTEIATIAWMDGTYTKYDLSTQEGDTHYARCTVRYYHPDKKTTIEGTAMADDYDPDDEDNLTLVVTNERVDSVAQAEALAAKLLRLHNKYEKKCTFTLTGNPMLGAGLTARLKGFGLWSAKYIIKQCKHEVGANGYTTKVTLRTIPDKNVSKTVTDAPGTDGGSGGGDGGSTKKTWKTTKACTVYRASTGGAAVGSLAKGVPVTLLGSTKNSRTYINGGGLTGYVPSGAIGKV